VREFLEGNIFFLVLGKYGGKEEEEVLLGWDVIVLCSYVEVVVWRISIFM
jgi:hypothetical protein